jgi:hypothetical protein
MVEVGKRVLSDPDNFNKLIRHSLRGYIKADGSVVKLRSTWELSLVNYLDAMSILYEYELAKFSYVFEGKVRTYIPDFYLTDYNVYLEVKPEHFINAPINVAKYNSVIDSGNRIYYVTYKEIESEESFKAFISTVI